MSERWRGIIFAALLVVGLAGMVRNSYVAERYSRCVEGRRVYGLTRHFAFIRSLGNAALAYDAHRISRAAYERKRAAAFRAYLPTLHISMETKC